jgi:[ribosomal protein S18]-alanine N-acetyltransferase
MIRAMQLEDLDTVVALEHQHQLHPWGRSSFEQALRLGQNCQVFEEGGQITGYGVANKGHGRNIYANSVKAGDALYAAWLENAGVSELWAQIETTNHAARLRLQRFDFECIGQVPSLYGPGIDAEVWRKRTRQRTADQALEST